jgi:hypothetical protein
MVTVRIRNKPDNPNRQPRGPAGSDVAPPAPSGRFQRGVDMITNALGNTEDRAADYFKAAEDARTGGFTFSVPADVGMANIYFGAPTEYDYDAGRYLKNELAKGTETMLDFFQIPFEAAGQKFLGLDVGSGQGYGDLDQILAMSPQFAGFNNPFFDKAYAAKLENTIRDIGSGVPQSLDELILSPEYQSYLRGQGFNIPSGYSIQQFYEDIVEPRLDLAGVPYFDIEDSADDYLATRMNPELDTYLPTQGFETMDDYYNAVYEDYERDVLRPAESKIYEELTGDYLDQLDQRNISNFAEQMGISENLASNILLGTDKEFDAGLFTDLFQVAEPGGGGIFDAMMSEYQTPEGKAFFEDPSMSMLGFLFGTRPSSNLFKAAIRSSPIIRGTVGQMYPSTAGLGLYIPKIRAGRFRIGASPLPRAIAQGLILADTEDE